MTMPRTKVAAVKVVTNSPNRNLKGSQHDFLLGYIWDGKERTALRYGAQQTRKLEVPCTEMWKKGASRTRIQTFLNIPQRPVVNKRVKNIHIKKIYKYIYCEKQYKETKFIL